MRQLFFILLAMGILVQALGAGRHTAAVYLHDHVPSAHTEHPYSHSHARPQRQCLHPKNQTGDLDVHHSTLDVWNHAHDHAPGTPEHIHLCCSKPPIAQPRTTTQGVRLFPVLPAVAPGSPVQTIARIAVVFPRPGGCGTGPPRSIRTTRLLI
jgi:hypothetical protein